MVRLLPEMALRASPLAVVAASQQPSVLHNHDHLLVVQDSKLGSPGQRFRILSALEQRELSEPPTRCRWPGCAGPSGVVLGLLLLASATKSTGSMMSTPHTQPSVCHHPCTSALTENAHIRLKGCAAGVGAWGQRRSAEMRWPWGRAQVRRARAGQRGRRGPGGAGSGGASPRDRSCWSDLRQCAAPAWGTRTYL